MEFTSTISTAMSAKCSHCGATIPPVSVRYHVTGNPGTFCSEGCRDLSLAATTNHPIEPLKAFDDVAARFTERVERAAGWTVNYFGSAWSTRLKQAIAELREAIVEAEQHPEIATRPALSPSVEEAVDNLAKAVGRVLTWKNDVHGVVVIREDHVKNLSEANSAYHDAKRALQSAATTEAKLREALREQAVTKMYQWQQTVCGSTEVCLGGHCLLCNTEWKPDQSEHHAPGCLAALAEGEKR